MRRLLLIVNPVAGKGQVRNCFYDVVTMLGSAGYVITTCVTSSRGDAVRFAAQFAPGHDAVVCIGGDGTLNEVVSGLMQLEQRPPLGYIPMGTANDVAATLDIPRNPTLAVEKFLSGKPFVMDVGRFEDKHFNYVAAFGAFTDVSYSTPQEQKKRLGHLAYVLSGIGQLPKLGPMWARVEHDSGVVEGEFLFGSVTNSTSVAGLIKLSHDQVSLDDGLFEVMLVREPHTTQEISDMITAVLNKTYKSSCVDFFKTKKIRFSFRQNVAWTLDGEDGGSYTEIEAENCAKAICLML